MGVFSTIVHIHHRTRWNITSWTTEYMAGYNIVDVKSCRIIVHGVLLGLACHTHITILHFCTSNFYHTLLLLLDTLTMNRIYLLLITTLVLVSLCEVCSATRPGSSRTFDNSKPHLSISGLSHLKVSLLE